MDSKTSSIVAQDFPWAITPILYSLWCLARLCLRLGIWLLGVKLSDSGSLLECGSLVSRASLYISCDIHVFSHQLTDPQIVMSMDPGFGIIVQSERCEFRPGPAQPGGACGELRLHAELRKRGTRGEGAYMQIGFSCRLQGKRCAARPEFPRARWSRFQIRRADGAEGEGACSAASC
ncbi:hypothetical protein B0H14DRAFT_3877336 [Mycena olivaceomarginata]|nr:hypothetical protein B0H14DRAFT_3877336 [Mycena olivaceomarginata]